MSNDFSQIQDYQGPRNKIALPEAGTTAMQTKTTYTTAVAVQEKRNLRNIRDDVLLEAQLAGGSFFYRWTVKGKSGTSVIQGGSIDLAMSLFRNYRNVAIEVDVKETPTHYLFTAYLVDLETGMTSPRMFRQRKRQNISGKMDKERQEDIVFQIGQSKAIRNAILRVMPSWLIDKAIEVAQQAELASIKPEQLADAREKAVAFFGQYGVSREEIEKKLGKTIEQMTAQDVIDLRGEARAIKDGHVSVRELFPAEDEEKPQDKQENVPGKQEDVPPVQEKPPVIEKEIPPETLDKATGNTADEKAPEYFWARDNWYKQRAGKPDKGTGFGAWVEKNLNDLVDAYASGEMPDQIARELVYKWDKLYPGVPFPSAYFTSGQNDEEKPAATDGAYTNPGAQLEGTQQQEQEAFEQKAGSGPSDEDLARFIGISQELMDTDVTKSVIAMVLGSDQLKAVWDKYLVGREFTSMEDMNRVEVYLRGQMNRETLANSQSRQ